MSEVRYFVDNNALAQIGISVRGSAFFRQRCHIPSDVLKEASGFPDFSQLRRLEYEVSIGVLFHLSEIMATLEPGDTGLIDLYKNLGRADPVLIACALYEMERSAETLFPQDWQVVTNDVAVRLKAEEFGVASLGAQEFTALLQIDP